MSDQLPSWGSSVVRRSPNRACALTNSLVRSRGTLYGIIGMTAPWGSVIVVFLAQRDASDPIRERFTSVCRDRSKGVQAPIGPVEGWRALSDCFLYMHLNMIMI